ncbi:hypothetical protein V5E97_05315 [Singulisphaera sp. Ch08]|uniref:Carboxypeptidase regulatory-like domain-containing protein n=1 Tax=Singulisphaera sp. Ch08 TaxID=3120278 RepID=A0AAU7CIZ3_9BACT
MTFTPRTSGRRLWWSFTALIGFSVLGCGDAESPEDETPPDYTKVVPVTGTVKLNGVPLPTAVVSFIPPKWPASNGETKADGTFTLETTGNPGVLPGEYRVSISYLVSPAGGAQGLGPRRSFSPPPGMLGAEEKLPPEYSDFMRTTLKRTVPATGGNFEFDIKADQVKIEPTKAVVEAEPAKTEPEAEPAKTEPAKTEPEPAKTEPAKTEPEPAKTEPAKTEPEPAKTEPAKTEPEPK